MTEEKQNSNFDPQKESAPFLDGVGLGSAKDEKVNPKSAEFFGLRKEDSRLLNDGFLIVDFKAPDALYEIQKTIESEIGTNPITWHQKNHSMEEHLAMAKKITDVLYEKGLVAKLLRDNISLFSDLLGPDIEAQRVAHFRMSRPKNESDFIDWHRDSFYGNEPWEINLWFPVFKLEEGAGLKVLRGSHLERAKNVRDATENDGFRKTVTKGSLANGLGYVYAPKIDDTIVNMDPEQVQLLSPKVGQGVLFFGHCVHRAQNESGITRLSIDTRLKQTSLPTNTKEGYYISLQ